MKYLVIILFLTFYRSASSQVNSHHKFRADTVESNRYIQLGLLKYNKKDYTGALVDFTAAAKYSGFHSGEAFRLKGASEFALDQYDSSFWSYTKAILINGRDAKAFKGRAESQRFRNNCKEALGDYDKALGLDPTDIEIYFGRGGCDYNLDLYEECIDDYTKFLKERQNSKTP